MATCDVADRLMQTLRVHVPGVTDPVLELELFNVMDEFFQRTSAWRYDTQIDMVEGQSEYGFTTPSDTRVVRMMAVTHQNIPVQPAQTATGTVGTSIGTVEPSQVFADGDVAIDPHHSDIQGGIFTYAVYRPNYLSLTSLPDAESRKNPLKAYLALSLARGCLECDCGDWPLEDWMWDMFFDDFLNGTLGRLYAMPAKPWASTVHAQYHAKRFRNQMAYRKQEAMRGFTFNVPIWRYPRWTS
jgi:hypothetical protein